MILTKKFHNTSTEYPGILKEMWQIIIPRGLIGQEAGFMYTQYGYLQLNLPQSRLGM